jgi:hypothetical protein
MVQEVIIMKEMNYLEREKFLKEEITHWGSSCYGCTPTPTGFKTEWGESVTLHIEGFSAVVVFRMDNTISAIYSLSLETGLALMRKNEFLPGGIFENESGGLIADFFGPIWSNHNDDGVFQLMNEPVIIDTSAPQIKPMTIDEIVNDIIGKICTDDSEDEIE